MLLANGLVIRYIVTAGHVNIERDKNYISVINSSIYLPVVKGCRPVTTCCRQC